jgi:hypothetical protein
MKKLELNQMEGLEGGRFWGTQESAGPCVNGVAIMRERTCYFWICSDYEQTYSYGCDVQ